MVRARPGIDTSKACHVTAVAAMAENHDGEEEQGDQEADGLGEQDWKRL